MLLAWTNFISVLAVPAPIAASDLLAQRTKLFTQEAA
jgi:hypothetical protein